jgi:hypothetical protein
LGGNYSNNYPVEAGIYDPIIDSWTISTALNAPVGRSNHIAVWTGSQMIVWGGYLLVSPGVDIYYNSGGIYTPPNVPTAPELVYPSFNETDISLTPTLDWNDVMSAESYSDQVSDNNSFSSLIYSQTGVTTSQVTIPENTLLNNMVYYWRVNAANVSGTGPWSEIWNFKTFSTPEQKVYLFVSFPGKSAGNDLSS